MKYQQLRIFLAVAEQRSIRAAARTLGLTQPAVTKTIRELESEFGLALVVRDVSGVTLTEYGLTFREHAQLLVNEMRRTRDAIEAMRYGTGGTVQIAVSPTVAVALVPDAVQRFRAALPGARVQFSEGGLTQSLSGLSDGSIDFMVAHGMPGAVPEYFRQTPLFEVAQVIGVRGSHPLAGARTLAELQDADWLVPSYGPRDLDLLQAIFTPYGLAVPASVMRCQSFLVAAHLLTSMDMLSVFTAPLVELELKPRGVVPLQLTDTLPRTMITIVTRPDERLTPTAQRMADCFGEAAQCYTSQSA